MRHRAIKALLIDIDDTITRHRLMTTPLSFFDVLQKAGVELAGLTPEESAKRVHRVNTEVIWWHWSDFILELGLNPRRFWDFAYAVESRYLEPTGPEILPALTCLHQQGILLYVTSNNPSSGILHKLRLAGIAHVNGTTLFSQLLGATELHAMKWDPVYWRKVLAHTALDAHEAAVVGDNPHDDYEVPHSVGIACSFIINRNEDLSGQNTESLIHVRDFGQIADIVLNANLHAAH